MRDRKYLQGSERSMMAALTNELDSYDIPFNGLYIYRDGIGKFRVHILLPFVWWFFWTKRICVRRLMENIIEKTRPMSIHGRVTLGWVWYERKFVKVISRIDL
jgi:hypothetical protein